jgi:RNA polymerase sigma-70 factor (ECF subfamily)
LKRRNQVIEADRVLMSRIANKEPSASRELVKQHAGPVARFAAGVLNDPASGEDIAHEVILRLWRGAGSWQGRGTIAGWLRIAAYRAAIDKLRKEQRLVADPDGKLMNKAEDSAPNPEDLIHGRQIGLEVQAVFSRLPDRQRAALILSYQDGLSGLEIAEILGVSLHAVESLLARGRRACRSYLAKTYADLSTYKSKQVR